MIVVGRYNGENHFRHVSRSHILHQKIVCTARSQLIIVTCVVFLDHDGSHAQNSLP